jgi:hypothetical protein
MPHEVTVIKGRRFPTCRHCKGIGGTEGSNPPPSTGESVANLTFGGASHHQSQLGPSNQPPSWMLGFGVIENARMTPAAAEISALAEEIRGY